MPLQQLDIFSSKRREGFRCSCCNQYVKEYSRSFNANMAIASLCLYKHSGGKFVHLEKFLAEQGHQRCGDASYLRFYNIIQKMEGDRKDGSPRNGFYKLTGVGILFCERKLKVQSKFVIFNNALQGFEGEEIDVVDALKNKFDYEKLMSA